MVFWSNRESEEAMKWLLILTGKVSKKREKLCQYLNQSLSGQAKVVLGLFSDLIFEVDGKDIKVKLGSQDITNFDLIYFRGVGSDFLTLAGNLAICLKHFGIEYIDTTFAQIGPFGSKMTSLLKLSLAGLPVIPSFYCQQDKIKKQVGYLVAKFGFPMVAKELSKQQGRGVFLLKERADFDFLKRVDPEDQFMFQKFYPNEEEYRLLVLGGEVAVWERKIRTDPKEFRSNVALGAREEFLNLERVPEEMKQMAVKAAKVLNYQIAGVDIMVDSQTGKKWLLEVNRGPGFTYDPKDSPELPAVASFFAAKLDLLLGRQEGKKCR